MRNPFQPWMWRQKAEVDSKREIYAEKMGTVSGGEGGFEICGNLDDSIWVAGGFIYVLERATSVASLSVIPGPG